MDLKNRDEEGSKQAEKARPAQDDALVLALSEIQGTDGQVRRLLERIETLQSANRALREEIKALKRANEWSGFQARLLNSVGQMVMATDLQGRVIYWNQASERSLGWQADEVLGRPVTELAVPAYNLPLAGTLISQLIQGGAWVGELPLLCKDGNSIDAYISLSGIRNQDELVGLLGVATDLTELKQAEARARRQAERAEALARVAASLNSTTDLDLLMERLCAETSQALMLPVAAVLLYDAQSADMLPVAILGLRDVNLDWHARTPMRAFELFYKLGQREVIIEDLQALGDRPSIHIWIEQNVRSVAGAAIYDQENLIGFLFVASIGAVHLFSQEELDLLHAFANQSALAIRNAKLIAETIQRTDELEVLVKVTAALRKAELPASMLPILVNETQVLVCADEITILTVDEAGFQVVAGYGKSHDLVGQRLSEPGVILAFAMRSSEVLFFTSPLEKLHLLGNHSLKPVMQALQSGMAAVLRTSEEETLGLLLVGYLTRHHFSPAEKRMMTALADIAGNALQRSMLMLNLEQRVAERTRALETLYKVSALASQSLELTDMLTQALEMVNDLVGARASSIHLVEVHPHSGQPCLMLVAQSGATPEAVELVKFLPMDHGLPAHVLNSGEAIITTDAIQDARTFSPQAFQSVGSSAYIGVPVRASRQALGVLSISKPTGEAVTEDDARLLMGVAEQIGAAVQMVRLSKQAEQAAVIEERQRLARDLHDSVTQALYGLELFAAAGLNQAEAEGQAIYQHHFSRVRSIAQYALREMRLLIHELRPPVLEQVGLVAALQQRLDAVEGRSGVSTRLLVDGEIHLPPRLETALYRIAQEALNNALKHSRAKTITVRLEIQNEELLLEVEDDGIGFISEQASSLGGMGLISMQERAGAIGAEFGTVSLPGKGTRVIVRVKYE